MPTKEFISHLKNRTAKVAIGAATLRGQGAPGVIAAARKGLQDIDLATFAVRGEEAFVERLDSATLALEARFPEGGRSWGGARKAVNIFLRDAVYNTDLSAHFGLRAIRPWLEVPLDSQIAKGLRSEPEGEELPQWPGVKHLQSEDNARFQCVASAVARRKRVQRVDLDVFYFRADPA